MPEQVETAALQQAATGEAHDLTDLIAVAGTVAVEVAVLAGRFGIEGAAQAASEGVGEELPAPGAEGVTSQAQGRQSRLDHHKGGAFGVVMGPAVDGGEQGEDLEVLELAAGQGRGRLVRRGGHGRESSTPRRCGP